MSRLPGEGLSKPFKLMTILLALILVLLLDFAGWGCVAAAIYAINKET
jgi:hypothetical protein